MASKTVLSNIKENLKNLVGEKVRLKSYQGKKKIIERTGTIEETYPNIFIIKLEGTQQNSRRVSYSYTDVLTESIEISAISANKEDPQQ